MKGKNNNARQKALDGKAEKHHFLEGYDIKKGCKSCGEAPMHRGHLKIREKDVLSPENRLKNVVRIGKSRHFREEKI